MVLFVALKTFTTFYPATFLTINLLSVVNFIICLIFNEVGRIQSVFVYYTYDHYSVLQCYADTLVHLNDFNSLIIMIIVEGAAIAKAGGGCTSVCASH